MPMTADEVCRALIHEADRMEGFYAEEEAAIREAFEVRDRAREELARAKRVQEESAGLQFARVEMRVNMLKRILGEEGK
jgi:hypothetical protein